MIKIDYSGHEYKIIFDYDQSIIDEIKSLPRRSWNKDFKYWTIDNHSLDIWRKKTRYKIYLTQSAKVKFVQYIKQLKFNKAASTIDENISIDYTEHGIYTTLFLHQARAIEFIENVKNKRVIINDPMGLGKSLIAIAYAAKHKLKSLVICQASLKLNFLKQIEEHSNKSVEIVKKPSNTKDFTITNYEKIVSQLDDWKKLDFDCLILDEAHFIKNYKSKRSKAVKKLIRKIPTIIMLTGTAIANRPIDGYGLFNLCDKETFNSYYHYVYRYCAAKDNGFGLDVSGASNQLELHNKLQHFCLRRDKSLIELPDKQRIIEFLEINTKEYRNKIEEINENLNHWSYISASFLAQMHQIRQLCGKLKIPYVVEKAKQLIDTDHCIIFTYYREILEMLEDEIRKRNLPYLTMRSSDSMVRRDELQEELKHRTSPCIFLTTIGIGGTGLNLQTATSIIFNDISLKQTDHFQAEDRIHRIGQSKNVSIYYPVFENTMEQELFTLIAEKATNAALIMDGHEEQNSLRRLFTYFKDRHMNTTRQ